MLKDAFACRIRRRQRFFFFFLSVRYLSGSWMDWHTNVFTRTHRGSQTLNVATAIGYVAVTFDRGVNVTGVVNCNFDDPISIPQL